MSIGRTFAESFLKGVRSLEMKVDHLYLKDLDELSREDLAKLITGKSDLRMYALGKWLRDGGTIGRTSRYDEDRPVLPVASRAHHLTSNP